MSGFYTDYEGEIYVNNINLQKININSLRSRIGIVFQDFNKYEMTLRENIGFGSIDEMGNDNKVLETIKKIKLDNKLDTFSDSLDSQMGKWFGGEELSKGQWQRVAIGRTIFRDSEVYILDEPTASLDPKFEKEIFRIIFDEIETKICLFITHRLSSIEKYNPRILLFDNGKLVGDNNNLSLHKDNILYQNLTSVS